LGCGMADLRGWTGSKRGSLCRGTGLACAPEPHREPPNLNPGASMQRRPLRGAFRKRFHGMATWMVMVLTKNQPWPNTKEAQR
jgi:hypothetical protein